MYASAYLAGHRFPYYPIQCHLAIFTALWTATTTVATFADDWIHLNVQPSDAAAPIWPVGLFCMFSLPEQSWLIPVKSIASASKIVIYMRDSEWFSDSFDTWNPIFVNTNNTNISFTVDYFWIDASRKLASNKSIHFFLKRVLRSSFRRYLKTWILVGEKYCTYV